MTTKPLKFDGTSLHVNVVVRSEGTLKVEVLDAADGKPIAGYSAEEAVAISGDQLDATVEWSGGKRLGDLAGREVRLRFIMVGADLYVFFRLRRAKWL